MKEPLRATIAEFRNRLGTIQRNNTKIRLQTIDDHWLYCAQVIGIVGEFKGVVLWDFAAKKLKIINDLSKIKRIEYRNPYSSQYTAVSLDSSTEPVTAPQLMDSKA